MLDASPEMVRLRAVMGGFVGGTQFTVGLFTVACAWFGLRAVAGLEQLAEARQVVDRVSGQGESQTGERRPSYNFV